jgi:hypothetical protein
MRPSDPPRVNLFAGVLYSDAGILEKALGLLESRFGEIDYRSPSVPFDVTDYYAAEMGSPIGRIFISFGPLIFPSEIARIKIETNGIEDSLAVDGKRKVNLDCGYLDYDKAVLASAKYNGQKIYLDSGIWADLTLHYEKKEYHPYPWSFPDFKSGRYNGFFLAIRRKYKVKNAAFLPRTEGSGGRSPGPEK